MKKIMEKASKIKMIIFDVDGVLTSGELFIGDDGQEYKAFNSLDGHGMKMLQNSGVEIAIITGRTSNVVKTRMKSLGITHLYEGQHDKRLGYKDLKEKVNLTDEEIAYVGDDVVDLPVMKYVGLSVAVNSAHPFVIKHADITVSKDGGRGAAREICELIMDAQGNLEKELISYLD
ncbi:MAG: 3-deoxy-manno-octulosonate-8-phosphatase KdsC [Methylococcales bacterium]|nr:3-deoxy-manno-octulosonate-8-phosphatase KdsC [Methylococcales bacterium]MBT7410493.1 3-deoxy-manno-octulosonate-8-phosphatase KdsC [Methylococcales bacterium]